MKEDLNKQDEALDALLKKAERPQAPDWFEARTMARLRRERAAAPSFHLLLFRFLATAACLIVFAFCLSTLTRHSAPAPTPLALQPAQDEQLYAALDAFNSYTQDAKDWNQEPY